MEFNQLKQFKAVASLKNIVEASRELFISQPALTRSIQKLEKELGVDLFDRSEHTLKLNKNGKFILSYANIISATEEKMLSLVKEKISERKLRIGSSFTSAMLFVIPEFANEYKELSVEQELNKDEYMKAYLLKNLYDIVITTHQYDDSIQSEMFIENKLYVSVPKGNALYSKAAIFFDDLKDETLIVCNDDSIYFDILKFSSNRNKIKFCMQSNLFACYNMMKQSDYLMFASSITKKYLNPDNRRLIPFAEAAIKEQAFYVSYLKENKEKVKPFLQWIKKEKVNT